MVENVDHIGIAVSDLEAAVEIYRDLLGLELQGEEIVPDQKVRVAKLTAGDDTIELLEATEEDSPVGRFVARRGPGIHHICLSVDDIEATLEKFKDRGMRLIDEEPRIGAGGHRIAFVHPASSSGVLIELSEKSRK